MSKFWRIALAWLLAVALPIQGYAAQTMLLCGPAQHQSSVMDERAGQGHDLDHAAMAHDAALVGASLEMSATAAHTDETPPAKVDHAGKCSVCSSSSACCSAAAITTTALTFAVSLSDLPEVPTVKLATDRVMVGGLDRPPRLSRI